MKQKMVSTKLSTEKRANSEADIGLINQHCIKELTAEDVFCFSVVLCDNEVDRDMERFPEETLKKLAPLFVGKTGIRDHRWSSKEQVARIYRTEVEATGEKNSLGEERKILRGDAYILRTPQNEEIISSIEGGITKEVSIGFKVEKTVCSICAEKFSYNWDSWKYICKNGHVKGEVCDGKICCGDLVNPKDAYEFSFVAVPAQPKAGVTKSFEDMKDVFKILSEEGIEELSPKAKGLVTAFLKEIKGDCNEDERQNILKEILTNNEKYLKKETKV